MSKDRRRIKLFTTQEDVCTVSDCRLFESIRKGERKRAWQSCSTRHFSNTWPGSQTATWSSWHLASSKGQTKPLSGQTCRCLHRFLSSRCDHSPAAPSLINYQHPCSISPGTALSAAGHWPALCTHLQKDTSQRTGSSRHSRKRENNLHICIHLSSFFIYKQVYIHTYMSIQKNEVNYYLHTYLWAWLKEAVVDVADPFANRTMEVK